MISVPNTTAYDEIVVIDPAGKVIKVTKEEDKKENDSQTLQENGDYYPFDVNENV